MPFTLQTYITVRVLQCCMFADSFKIFGVLSAVLKWISDGLGRMFTSTTPELFFFLPVVSSLCMTYMYQHVHVYVHVNPTTLFIQLLLDAGILIVFYWFVDLHFRE